MVTKSHNENELPGPPSKPQVTDVTKNSVSLSWQPGLAGVSPVSSFVIEAFRLVFSTSCIFTLNVFNDIVPCNWTCSSAYETKTSPANLKGILSSCTCAMLASVCF